MLSSAFRFRALPLRLSPDFRPPEISCPRFLVLIITFRRSHFSVIVEKPFSGDLPDKPFLRRYTAASAAPGTYRYVLQKNGVPKKVFLHM